MQSVQVLYDGFTFKLLEKFFNQESQSCHHVSVILLLSLRKRCVAFSPKSARTCNTQKRRHVWYTEKETSGSAAPSVRGRKQVRLQMSFDSRQWRQVSARMPSSGMPTTENCLVRAECRPWLGGMPVVYQLNKWIYYHGYTAAMFCLWLSFQFSV